MPEDTKDRLDSLEKTISGQIVHASTISRVWSAVLGLLAVLALAAQIGAYKQKIDDMLGQVTELVTNQERLSRRVDFLEALTSEEIVGDHKP